MPNIRDYMEYYGLYGTYIYYFVIHFTIFTPYIFICFCCLRAAARGRQPCASLCRHTGVTKDRVNLGRQGYPSHLVAKV